MYKAWGAGKKRRRQACVDCFEEIGHIPQAEKFSKRNQALGLTQIKDSPVYQSMLAFCKINNGFLMKNMK